MSNRPLSVLLVDPSLFTAPYDEGITKGLEANGLVVTWACRDPRPNEEHWIVSERQATGVFYPGLAKSVKNAGLRDRAVKGISHAASLVRLWRHVLLTRPDVVHFQWSVLPLLDTFCIAGIQRVAPVVLTIHDTLPFNGNPTSRLQTVGLARILRRVDHIIVHTRRAAELIAKIAGKRTQISVVAHGPLGKGGIGSNKTSRFDHRWTVVMFGKLQAYKGVDTLVEAIILLAPETRKMMRFVVAGEAFIDTATLIDRVNEAGINECIEFRFERQSDEEVSNLLAEADSFVFPYRQIDASGVFYLVAQYGKWIVASDIGIFHEEIQEDINGALVLPNDANALAVALTTAVGRAPTAPLTIQSWEAIGLRTLKIYESLRRRAGK